MPVGDRGAAAPAAAGVPARRLVDRVLAWADVKPDAVALVSGGERLTYGELAEEVTRLAEVVRARADASWRRRLRGDDRATTVVDVSPQDVPSPPYTVVWAGPRSCGLVVAQLAVWAARGCCVVLGEGVTARRRRAVLRNARPVVELTAAAAPSQAAAHMGTDPGASPHNTTVGSSRHVSAHPPPDSGSAPPSGCGLTALEEALQEQPHLYISFTSGSTGEPKGVLVKEASVLNVIDHLHTLICPHLGGGGVRDVAVCPAAAPEVPHRAPSDDTGYQRPLLLAVSPETFDISYAELYYPLVYGGTVVIHGRGQEQLQQHRHLLDDVRTYQPDVLQATPATWQLLLASGWRGAGGGGGPDHGHGQGGEGDHKNNDNMTNSSAPAVRLVGGEAFPPSLVAPLLDGARLLLNLYGPTETTIWVMHHTITHEDLPLGSAGGPAPAIPLGSAFPGNTLEVRDDGELVVRGANVATGYTRGVDGEGAAAAAGTVHHFHGVFATGDIVRRRLRGVGGAGGTSPDGVASTHLEFLARRDGQVKIRGNRVELGEIEALAHGVAGVAHAACVNYGTGANGHLVLFYTVASVDADSGADADAGDIGTLRPRNRSQAGGAEGVGAEGEAEKRSHNPSGDDRAAEGAGCGVPMHYRTAPSLKPALHRALRPALPPYAVPSIVCELLKMPVSTRGKVDRACLRGLDPTPLYAVGARGGGDGADPAVVASGEPVSLAARVGAVLAVVEDLVRGLLDGWCCDPDDAVHPHLDSISILLLATGLEAALRDRFPRALPDKWSGVEDGVPLVFAAQTLRGLAERVAGVLGSTSGPFELPAGSAPPPGPSPTPRRKNAQAHGDAAHGGGRGNGLVAPAPPEPAHPPPHRLPDPNKPNRKTAQARGGKAAPQLPPLLHACKAGDLDEAQRLVAAVVDRGDADALTTLLEQPDRFGSTAVHYAAGAGCLPLCQLLVRHGADHVKADKKSGRTALHWAARQGHLGVCQWFVNALQHDLEVRAKDDTTPVQLAAWGGHVDVCKWLIAAGADITFINKWGCTAVHFAALAGHAATCEWLATVPGLMLTHANTQGHNALHKAAYGGHLALCRWLLEGPPCMQPSSDVRGQLPSALAAKAGYAEVAGYLTTFEIATLRAHT